MTNAEKVKHFMLSFEQEVKAKPEFANNDIQQLRIRLVREEFNEVLDSIFEGDLTNFGKELCDLLYVVYGMAHANGIDIDSCFELVHKSNMSKLGEDGKPVYRDDGKVIKGPNYKAPDLTKLIQSNHE